jgi:hypothetical protein
MANPAGESNDGVLKLDFDRLLMLEFRGSVITPMPDCWPTANSTMHSA